MLAMMALSIRSSGSGRDGATRAFTLVELLVTIAIIGVLVSLLLPAVQSAREAARRLQCQSNLKQLCLAIQNYESNQGKLPPSGIVEEKFEKYFERTYPVFDQRSGPMLSWIVLVLPYLEETALADQFDLDRSVLDQNGDPQSRFLSILACPSDQAQGRYFVEPASEDSSGADGEKRFAKGNYAAYTTPYHSDLQLLYPGTLIQGGQKLSRITDGLSQTIVLSEVRTLDHPRDERGVWALPWNAASLLAMDMHHDSTGGSYDAVFGKFTILRSFVNQSQTPNFMGPNSDVLIECSDETLAEAQLSLMPCVKWGGVLGRGGYISSAPRSLHPGGVYVSYLDGRVSFLRDDIDPITMALQIGIHDELVSLPELQQAVNSR